MCRALACLVLASLSVAPAWAQAKFPPPTGYVNDFANILDAQARESLDAVLRAAEAETSAEIVLTTVPSLDGMSVEEYANRMFAEWGVGKKRQDNGVLVLVAPNEREMRIEVGYGLEGILPDGLAGEIIRTDMAPRFRDDDYPSGIKAGVGRVVSIVEARHVLTPEERAALESSGSDDVPLWIIIPFFAIFVGIGGFSIGIGLRTKTFFGLLFGGMFSGMPLLMSMLFAFWPTISVLLPLVLIMIGLGYRLGGKAEWQKSARGPRGKSSTGWVMGGSSSSGSSSGGGWSSGGGSSSGGSFGGGSSGGGGASGKW